MIISLSVLVVCIMGSTYALYRTLLSKNIGINTNTHGLDYYINYVKGTDITAATLNPSASYEGGASSNIVFWKRDDSYDIYGKMELTVNTIGTNLKNSPALKYAVVNNGNVLSTGSLKGTSSGSKVTILKNLYLEQTRQIYTVYIWLDSSEEPGNISNESLSISVDCTASLVKDSAATYITDLYTNASKTEVTNNSITYNTASSVSLMNDRKGSASTGIDSGNIRYYGANPNNYVYFNCTTYPSTGCELWRIIGVFDGKLKIKRNSSIGSLAWDQDKNDDDSITTYDNDWTTATLQTLLNIHYYKGTGTVTYYSGQTGTTANALNMGSLGIKNDTTRNMIANTTWNIGGWGSNYVFPNQIYGYERGTTVYSGRSTTWSGKITLIYPSDYTYAVDLSTCSNPLIGYSVDTCTQNNWLYGNYDQWFLTPSSGSSSAVWYAASTGTVNYNASSYNAYPVFPVLYLDTDVEIVSGGDGSSSNPYRLSM